MRSKIIQSILVCGLSISLLISGCGQAPDSSQGSSNLLIVNNGTLIRGDRSAPIPNGLVVIEGGRILFSGPEDDYIFPRGTEILDAGGGTILPGFIDSHTHNTADPALRQEFLINGVTTVCDLGSPLYHLNTFKKSSYREQPIARGIAAGPIITAPGGLPGSVLDPELNYEVASPKEGRAAVDDLYQRGAGLIKIYLQAEANGTLYPSLDQATLEAIVQAAHQKNLPVRAHVTYISFLGMAVSAGVDVIEHIPINVPSADMDLEAQQVRSQMLLSQDPLNTFLTEVFPDYSAQLRIMAEKGIILVPTLERPFSELFIASSQDPELAAAMGIILGIVGRYHELGGSVGLGTDFNLNTGMFPGIPLGELQMLQAAGLDPLAVIEASTKNAAAACGVGSDLGILEPGMIADLIVVGADPLVDLAALENIKLVIKDGRIAYQADQVE